MDEVLAMSTALRATHRSPTTHWAAVDDIPALTRALSQIHSDSSRQLASHAAAGPTSPVHTPAIRLFSSIGFHVDRLRRAILSLDLSPPFSDTPHRPVPPFHHPSWLSPRALDDARLSLNASLRDAIADALNADLSRSRRSLLDNLSKLYPPHTPASKSRPHILPRTPTDPSTLPFSRRPRTPNSANTANLTPTSAPAVAAFPLPESYVSAASAVASGGEVQSVSTLIHDAAIAAQDVPHFVSILDILLRVSRFTRSEPPPQDVFVWAARSTLEHQFSFQIPGLPPNPATASPQSIIPHVEAYVASKYAHMPPMSSAMLGTPVIARPSIWPCVFFCLRIGAVSAATHLLQRTSSVPAEFFEWFEQGRDNVRSQFWRNVESTQASTASQDAAQQQHDSMHDIPYPNMDMPIVPGCLTTEQMYEAVAAEYRSASLSLDDAYMRACYVLLLRLDLSNPSSIAADGEVNDGMYDLSRRVSTAGGKHERFSLYLSDDDFEEVFPSVEDYLWLRLWLCRTESEQSVMKSLPNSSFLTLNSIRSEISACGENHFDSDGTQPLLYAFVLAASVQLEKAVLYLYEHTDEHWLNYSVHLAMVLYHKRWVVSDTLYERMIARYVEQVGKRSVVDGIVYILTLRRKQEVERLLIDYILESGEFDLLLGHAGKEDGAIAAMVVPAGVQTVSGFGTTELAKVREEAGRIGAMKALQRGELSRAGDLLEIAGRWTQGVEMRMRDAAGEVHKLWSGRRSSVLLDARRAFQMALARSDEKQDGLNVEVPRLKMGLQMLLDMGSAFEDYWTGRYAAAWERLRVVELVPMCEAELLTAERLVIEVSQWWDGDNASGGETPVSECVVEMVKVALHVAEYALESGSVQADGGSNATYEALPTVEEIKTLAVFATMLRRKERNERRDAMMDERLVRIESLLMEEARR